ncbi:nitrate- and nitrite sensing domain-containing protein [Halomonas sp. ML-15]|uniref:methyl-accepting chemotaxis protein n=1 Tax=Halomonas sp. ML-15 TaxID=2773305 RepID=UPI001746111C|nr:methyl-accepting chemotaxis protein [Halomonas sp. ML-15]MBD3896141.1 nitrate- and nitrite sensing domain-containing protein [Halomonas sp. ML-15]
MKLLHRVPMGMKFMLVLLLPLLAVFYFAGSGAWERWQLSRSMHQVAFLTEVASDAGNLVHALQAERGLSAGFLNSDGREFSTELNTQRQRVDEAQEAFAHEVAGLPRDALAPEVNEELDATLAELGAIAELRQRVDGGTFGAEAAIDAYTTLNNRLIDIVPVLTQLTDQGRVVEQIAGYYNLLKAKDLVGVERAVLASVFAADAFDGELLQRLLGLTGAEAAYIDGFHAFSTADQRDGYAGYLDSDVVRDALTLRERAIAGAEQGGFGVDAGDWFRLQTERIGLLKSVEDDVAAGLLAESQALRQTANQALSGYLLVAGLVIGLALMLAWWITRSIVAPLKRTLHRIASSKGDLTQRLEVLGSDELSQLNLAYNTASDSTEQMVLSIKRNAESISSASGEIAQGNQDLAQRTEEQSSSLVETATSLEQVTATVRQTADNAEQGRQLAGELDAQTRQAGHTTGDASSAMEAIKASNHKVTSIVTAIDEIAFQTNLLALNASVEAARAGEHGRGFAVVAAEVRKLAQRCASEANEIRRLVAISVEKINEGEQLVDTSSQQLKVVVEGMSRMSHYVSDIAAAAIEQSAGIEQINQAMSQLEEVTQQNAALVEQAAAASKSLDDQSDEMTSLVGRFKVREATQTPRLGHAMTG